MQDRAETPLHWRRTHAAEMADARIPTKHGTEADTPEAVRQQKRAYAKSAGGRGGQARRFARKRGSR